MKITHQYSDTRINSLIQNNKKNLGSLVLGKIQHTEYFLVSNIELAAFFFEESSIIKL